MNKGKILSKLEVKEFRVEMDRGIIIGRYYEDGYLNTFWIPLECYSEEFHVWGRYIKRDVDDEYIVKEIIESYYGGRTKIDDAIYQIANRTLTAYYNDVAEYLCECCGSVHSDCECIDEDICMGDCSKCDIDREECTCTRKDS